MFADFVLPSIKKMIVVQQGNYMRHYNFDRGGNRAPHLVFYNSLKCKP